MSKSQINHPSVNTYSLKIQSVRTIEVETSKDGQSVGSFIDSVLADCYVDGWYPNKLTLCVNPLNMENHPERID